MRPAGTTHTRASGGGPTRRRWLLAATAAAVAVLAAACTSTSSSDEATAADEATSDSPAPIATSADEADATGPADDGVLRMVLPFPPEAGLSIDTDDAFTLTRVNAVEGLTRSGADGEPEPALAESWERVDDVTWEFALRPGVVFHDGTPLTAAAVVTALDYVTNASAVPRSLRGIGIVATAPDDSTVRITTTEPDAILPLRLSAASAAILAPAAYEVTPPDAVGTGTGPFVIVEVDLPSLVVVERFDDYWGAAPALDGAEVRFLPDASSRAAAIRAGEAHIATGIPISALPELADAAGIELIGYPLPRTVTIYANTSDGPLADPVVREAVDLIIDRASIASDLLEGEFVPATSYFRAAADWAPDSGARPGDAVDKALALLAEAGYGAAGEALTVSLWTYPDRPELAEIATVVQAMLQEAGFTVELEVTDYNLLEPRVLGGEHDLFVLSRSYYTDIADAGAFLTSDFGCDGGYNLNRYCSDELDALLADIAAASEPAERRELFTDAASILIEERVGFPIAHDQARTAVSERVQGFEPDPFERVLLTTELRLGS